MELVCNSCNMIYKTINGLSKHNKKYHSEKIKNNTIKIYLCKYCNSNFEYRQSKWTHEQKCKLNNKIPVSEQIVNLNNQIKNLKEEIQEKTVKINQPVIQEYKNPQKLVSEQLLNIIMEKNLSINKLKQDLDNFKNKEIQNNNYFLCKLNEPLHIIINNVMFMPRNTDNYFDGTFICKSNNKEINDWISLPSTKLSITELSKQLNVDEEQLIDINNDIVWIHPTLTLILGQWISPSFLVQSCLWLTSFLLNYDENKRKIENQDNQISTLKNICLKKQSRIDYLEKNVVYVLTTEDLKNKRIYIIGKTQNLKKRLSNYNKTSEHQVIYYKSCDTIENMNIVEQIVLNKLNNYREKSNRDRFILPIDKDITFITNIIDTSINFQLKKYDNLE